jgi:hypothetical protein
MSPYEAGWRDGYNGRDMIARPDPAYRTGYADGQRDKIRNARILAAL